MTDAPGIASDHALLLAAICAGKARYVPPWLPPCDYCLVFVGDSGSTWGFSVTMDSYGCPVLDDGLRSALTKTMEAYRVQNLRTAE